jgi:hypothetical protein
MSLKIGSTSHVPLWMTTSQALGSTRGILSTKPPPVMWARALIVGQAGRLAFDDSLLPGFRERRDGCPMLNFFSKA